MVDYNFYTNNYFGDTGAFKDVDIWRKYESKAVDKLNYLTYGRLKKLDSYSDDVKKAVCSIADSLYAIDSIKKVIQKNDGAVVSSMSSLGVSVSYSNELTSLQKASASDSAERTFLMCRAKEYLQGSGLLYAGF